MSDGGHRMSRKSKILVVDDDPFSLDLLRQELEHLGHDINTCTNGKKAIEKIDLVPESVKENWLRLAYKEIVWNDKGVFEEYIDLLDSLSVMLEHRRHSSRNMVYLKNKYADSNNLMFATAVVFFTFPLISGAP